MSWRELGRELDRWLESSRTATFWWRDDDATTRNGALDRLLVLGGYRQVPVALAVIPGRVDGDLVAAVAGTPTRVLQHGCRHVNRAPPNAKKCELIAGAGIEQELAAGLAQLAGLFDSASLPVLVPPWNRIDPALVPRLGALGYRGLSRFKPRDGSTIMGLHQVNTHIDIIGWHSGRGFRGEQEALASAVEHLRARRLSAVDPDEPTGLLTHHLEHDEPCWTFIDRLLEETHTHPAVRWLSAEEIFAA